MKFIIELDGVVLDQEAAYWAAYGSAVASVGLARTDADRFWRVVRKGEPLGRAVAGSKPAKSQEIEKTFAIALESDECIEAFCAHENIDEAIRRVKPFGECILVTLGANRSARQRVVDRERLSDLFMRMQGLSANPEGRVKQFAELLDGDTHAMVLASSVPMVRAAANANLSVVGIASGAAIGRRLTQAGACEVFGDMVELARELETGSPKLSVRGLVPPMRLETPQRDERSDSRRNRGGYRRGRRY